MTLKPPFSPTGHHSESKDGHFEEIDGIAPRIWQETERLAATPRAIEGWSCHRYCRLAVEFFSGRPAER